MSTTVQLTPSTAQSTSASREQLTSETPATVQAEAFDVSKVIAALPQVVDTAMRKALPDQYTPETAAQVAADAIARVRSWQQHPLTAAQRGPAWIARYGCNPECQLDHAGADGEPGWHSTAPIETEHRSIDDNHSTAENQMLPLLGAQIVVDNERSQAYGRHTYVWLHLGTTTGTLTAAQAREALTAIRGFAAEFEAVVDLAEAIAAADFDGDPEIARLDREAENARIRAVTEGRG
ncbi:hypothetical protein ABT298_21350 [Streptomyces sp. NPDC001034]|uniref:hypothetical protein n=1 Tax=Streptomyces sp. NPDC001034 TaxID=3154375 RepID=UPI00331F90F7